MIEQEKRPEQIISQIISLIEKSKKRAEGGETRYSPLDNLRETIPPLVNFFEKIKKEFKKEKPTFLDCGLNSGWEDGLMMVLASYVGFKSFGIEINRDDSSIVRKINHRAFKQQIIKEKGQVAVGSYYYYVQRLLDDSEKEEIKKYESSGFADDFIKTGLGIKIRGLKEDEKILDHILRKEGPDPYKELNLLDKRKGGALFLKADLIYCSGLDLFFNRLFLKQLEKFSTTDELLVAILVSGSMGGVSKTEKEIFSKKDSFLISSKTRIHIFGKK
jgi:hypothetical protein